MGNKMSNEPEKNDNDWEAKLFYTLAGIAVGMTIVLVLEI